MRRRVFQIVLRLGLAAGCALFAPAISWGQQSREIREAYNSGVKHLRDKNYKEAQVALEQALGLAANVPEQIRVYDLLVVCYRQLPESDKMIAAQEFLIQHSATAAKRSLSARALASFLRERGKIDEAVIRYEKRLKEDADDHAAVAMMAVITTHLERDAEKGKLYTERLKRLEKKVATQSAEKLEQAAAASPELAAWHLKDAALAWLEAEEPAKALEAAKQSAGRPAEQRSTLLTYYWRDSLGDVFTKTGKPDLAIPQYEAAIAVSPVAVQKEATGKKLAAARAAVKPN